MSIQLIARLKELYKESQGGAPDGPVCKSSAATDERASATDERASQRGEYENFLIPQTPSESPLATQQGVSGGDERQYVLRTNRLATLAPASEGSEGQAPG